FPITIQSLGLHWPSRVVEHLNGQGNPAERIEEGGPLLYGKDPGFIVAGLNVEESRRRLEGGGAERIHRRRVDRHPFELSSADPFEVLDTLRKHSEREARLDVAPGALARALLRDHRVDVELEAEAALDETARPEACELWSAEQLELARHHHHVPGLEGVLEGDAVVVGHLDAMLQNCDAFLEGLVGE